MQRTEGFQPQQQNTSAAFFTPPLHFLLGSSQNPEVQALKTLLKTMERSGMPYNGWKKAESSISVMKIEQTNVKTLFNSYFCSLSQLMC